MSNLITISRDPFARSETVREVVHTNEECAWCGRSDGRLFRYGTQSDGGRTWMDRKQFCSRSCQKSYYR